MRRKSILEEVEEMENRRISSNSVSNKFFVCLIMASPLILIGMIFVGIYTFSGGSDKASKDVLKNQSTNAVRCQNMIKGKLSHPNTFNRSFSEPIKYSSKSMSYVIEIKFSAKNSFGVEINHIGQCSVINGSISSAEIY